MSDLPWRWLGLDQRDGAARGRTSPRALPVQSEAEEAAWRQAASERVAPGMTDGGGCNVRFA
jgi:hypothetical protein